MLSPYHRTSDRASIGGYTRFARIPFKSGNHFYKHTCPSLNHYTRSGTYEIRASECKPNNKLRARLKPFLWFKKSLLDRSFARLAALFPMCKLVLVTIVFARRLREIHFIGVKKVVYTNCYNLLQAIK